MREKQMHKIVPIEPTQSMCTSGQQKASEWQRFPLKISAIYKAMPSAAPDVAGDPFAYYQPIFREKYGEQMNVVVTADELNKFDKSMPENIETIDIWLAGQPLYTSPHPDRTAELEDKVKRLVEALDKILTPSIYPEHAKHCEDGRTLLAEINETSGFIGGVV